MLFSFYRDKDEYAASLLLSAIADYENDFINDSKTIEDFSDTFIRIYISKIEEELESDESIDARNILLNELSVFADTETIDGVDILKEFKDCIYYMTENKQLLNIDKKEYTVDLLRYVFDIPTVYLRELKFNTHRIMHIARHCLKHEEDGGIFLFYLMYFSVRDGGELLTEKAILNKDNKEKNEVIKKTRKYTQLLLLLLHLSLYSCINQGKKSSERKILGILLAAFMDGEMSRECKFYEKRSMHTMLSLGQSFNKRNESGKKDDVYIAALEHAEKMWRDKNDTSQHHEMAKYLMNRQEFSMLHVTTLREKLKDVAKKYGKVRGVKKGTLS